MEATMADKSPTFLFAGGGTGGHLFPGIAVAEELLARIPNAQILFAGSERDVEAAIVKSAGYRHVALPSPPSTMLRRHPLRFVVQYLRACRDARQIVAETRPAAVVGLGGFASVPLVTAADKLHLPIVLLEQNAVAGRATRRLAKLADVVCHTFASAVPRGRAGSNAVVTGNPVRAAIAGLVDGVGCPEFNFPPESSNRLTAFNGKLNSGHPTPTLLVLGGSQGSTAVNEAVLVAADRLRDPLREWEIVHQCGPHDGDRIVAAYRGLELAHVVQPFFDDLPRRYRSAGIAVSRAGATTLAELACAGIPAVLMPYPHAVHNHQLRNAEAFAAAWAACIVRQQRSAEESGQQLAAALQPLLRNAGLRRRCAAAMRRLAVPDAAANVAGHVLVAASLSLPAVRVGAPHIGNTAGWVANANQPAGASRCQCVGKALPKDCRLMLSYARSP
jgi:UDP-N-acetylglucosamine--N-acetylmuramyl-(pentapeptide) pyrophosphoryl-undecaprenol N-acetylglucosamine transferase